MSRVLKFRIWDKADKKYMVLGATGLDARNGDVIDYYNEGDRLGGPEEYDVEQYTGLKDKNGKGVYEGDIVEANYFESHYAALDVGKTKQITGSIHFGSGCFYISSMSDETPLFQSGGSNNVEVIGNIHENKELLDGSN